MATRGSPVGSPGARRARERHREGGQTMNHAQIDGFRKLARVLDTKPTIECGDCIWRAYCQRMERREGTGCTAGAQVSPTPPKLR